MQVARIALTCNFQRAAPLFSIMSESIFFDGKVRKRTLPVFDQPPYGNSTEPKRLMLPQGELANFYNSEKGIRYMALVELRLNGIRGNHVHRVKEEHVYLVSGELVLIIQEGKSGPRESVSLQPGDLVTIATGIAHAMKPTTPGYAIEFSEAPFDATDVERVILI